MRRLMARRFAALWYSDVKCDSIVYGSATVGANFVNEDRFCVVSNKQYTVGSVFDGHGGAGVSQYLCRVLSDRIFNIFKKSGPFDNKLLGDKIGEVYRRVDDDLREIVLRSESVATTPNLQEGSCSLTAVISDDSVLVASAGDSRAFLVERAVHDTNVMPSAVEDVYVMPSVADDVMCVALQDTNVMPSVAGDVLCVALQDTNVLPNLADDVLCVALQDTNVMAKVDELPVVSNSQAVGRWVSYLHTADCPLEQARLRLEHPGENDVVHCRQKIVELDVDGSILSTRWGACYVKSRLQPTRAFGDFYLKDLRVAVPTVSSPPYIDASPSVCTFPRVAGNLLILATDGLWDYISPQTVLDITTDNPNFSPNELAELLVEAALTIAAETSALSLAELKEMPQDQNRRNIHDDITVLVFRL